MSATDLLAGATLLDHHCHGVVTEDLDRGGFEELMNEAAHAGPLGTTLFDSMVGLAVRRWCAPVLDLAPFADPGAYLARRRELGWDEVSRRMMGDLGVSDLLVDTGFGADRLTGPAATAAYAGARGHEVVRLEATAERLLADGVDPAALDAAVRGAVRGSLAVKSIAAYRSGLALPAAPPAPEAVVTALRGMRAPFRIVDPVLNGWLAWLAVEEGLPLQVHVGYGDNDVDLHRCDPLLMTGFLRATQERAVPVLLLHTWPFHRHAAYLAQVFDQVFVDVGLATHNTAALSTATTRELLELAPWSKVLYSSDAFGLPELYRLGALYFRRALGTVLDELLDAGEMGEADAAYVVRLVTQDNARRAYRLEGRP